jgi:hypothetical protein
MSAGRRSITDNKEWGTPEKIVDTVKEFWDGEIDLDPCSNEFSIVNAKVEYRLPRIDGLEETWNFKRIFVNPPYGKDKERGTTIKDWVTQCNCANVVYNSEVIALIPVATNTTHWKINIFGNATNICFLKDTRLKFLENGYVSLKGAPMACALVYWGFDNEQIDPMMWGFYMHKRIKKFNNIFSKLGACVDISDLVRKRMGLLYE